MRRPAAVCLISAALLGVAWGGLARSAPAAKQAPSWAQCQQIVRQQLAKFGTGQPLTVSKVQAVLQALKAHGWQVADQAAILELVPGDDEFFVQQLATARGKAFAKHLDGRPDDYSRLERLSRIPDGQKMIRDLMAGPDGYHDMLAYMISVDGGRTLWSIVPGSRDAHDFNVPTGRLYTEKQLLERLEPSYAQLHAARRAPAR